MSAHKGSILLPLISAVAVLALVTAGYFYWQSQQYKGQALGPYTPPLTKDETVHTEADRSANWKTYVNEPYGFSFKYPNELTSYGLISGPGNRGAIAIVSLGDPTTGKPNTDAAFNGFSVSIVLNTEKLSLNQFVTNEKKILSSNAEIMNGKIDQSKQQEINTSLGGQPGVLLSGYSWDSIKRYYTLSPNKEYFLEISSVASDKLFPSTIDQILSTFKFTNTAQTNSDAKIYTSTKLGVSFNYSGQWFNTNENIQVHENGNKIYVYPSTYKDYTQGQWIEVFSKANSDSLSTSIEKKFLANYSKTDCFIATPQKVGDSGSSAYPSSYKTAIIGVPKSENDDLSTLLPKWEKCPQPYVTENGISYFLEDLNHPDKFVYFSIGQYPLDSGLGGQLTWQDTIKFL